MVGTKKKQIPLRLSENLFNEISAWAEDDFRSVNGQIEYLLTECVRQRKKNGRYTPSTYGVPEESSDPDGSSGSDADQKI